MRVAGTVDAGSATFRGGRADRRSARRWIWMTLAFGLAVANLAVIPSVALGDDLAAPLDRADTAGTSMVIPNCPALGAAITAWPDRCEREIDRMVSQQTSEAVGLTTGLVYPLNPLVTHNNFTCPSADSCRFEIEFTSPERITRVEACLTWYTPRGTGPNQTVIWTGGYTGEHTCWHQAAHRENHCNWSCSYMNAPGSGCCHVEANRKLDATYRGSTESGHYRYSVVWTEWHSFFACKERVALEIKMDMQTSGSAAPLHQRDISKAQRASSDCIDDDDYPTIGKRQVP